MPTELLKQADFPDNARVVYTYDAALHMTEATGGTGNKIRYIVDLAGNVRQEDTKTAGGVVRHTLSRVFSLHGQAEAHKARQPGNPA